MTESTGQENQVSNEVQQETPPAKKAAAKKATTKRAPAKRAAAPRAKQVAVRMLRKSRGVPVGARVDVDEERAAELVGSGLASYLE